MIVVDRGLANHGKHMEKVSSSGGGGIEENNNILPGL